MSDRVLVDSNIVIEHLRCRDKTGSRLSHLERRHFIAFSVISEYEILNGMTKSHQNNWDDILERAVIVPVDRVIAQLASRINLTLKARRKQVELDDLLIAATALAYGLPLATLNRKHFERIDGLELVRFPILDEHNPDF